ncbi:hypothetical protein B0H13DRAFT_1850440 [Mycena leptocephala]|nr:hypothetical protein B0H13DRAFT_1850440 [Mycena leptocephala]
MHGWECTYRPFEIFRFPNLMLLDLTLGKWPAEALLSLQAAPTFTLTHLSLHSTYSDTEDGVALVLRFLAQSPTIENLQLKDISGSGLIQGLTYVPSDDPVLLPRLERLWISICSWHESEETCPDDRIAIGAPPFVQLWDFCLKCWKPKFSVSVQERLAYLEEDGRSVFGTSNPESTSLVEYQPGLQSTKFPPGPATARHPKSLRRNNIKPCTKRSY